MDVRSISRDKKGRQPQCVFKHSNEPSKNKYKNVKGKEKDIENIKTPVPFKSNFKGNKFNSKHGKNHKGAFAQALEEYKLKKTEEQKRKEENKNRKEEMNKALQRYKEKKAQKLKKICKKTKKGQPIMKYWIEDMLEKIKSSS